MQSIKSPSVDRLFGIILDLNDVDECYKFFEDLCTVKEIRDMAQRFDTALLLDENKNYQRIIEEVGTSTATISRVNKCLRYGTGGYELAIKKFREKGAK